MVQDSILLVVHVILVEAFHTMLTTLLREPVIGHVTVDTTRVEIRVSGTSLFFKKKKASERGFFLAKNTIYIYCASRSEYERSTYLIYDVSYPST